MQLSTTETSYSPLFGIGLMFETDPNKIDPPEGQGGGGTGAPVPPSSGGDEEPSGEGN